MSFRTANSPEENGLRIFTYLLVSLVALVTILVYTEEYIVPFLVALILWFIIHEMRETLQWIPWVRRSVPIWIQSTIAFIIITLVLMGIVELIYYNMSLLFQNIELYEKNWQIVLLKLNEVVGMDAATKINEYTSHIDLTALATSFVDAFTLLVGDGFLIMFYVIFLLVEESIFYLKLNAFFPDEEKLDKIEDLFYKMDQNIGMYLRLKTFISLLTAVLSYFALLFIGVQAPLFWSFLIFVLNFIPTVGSLVATIFPALFAIVQMAEIAPFIYVILSVGAIQMVVGNILEPKLMGTSLNISSLVVLLSLTIWGGIWGIMGMILSVPITVVMIIIFEEIPSLRFIAVALSEKGEVSGAPKKPRKKKVKTTPVAVH